MDAPCVAPSRVTQKIFVVLVEWYHHIVLTMSFKLVSFVHLCYISRVIADFIWNFVVWRSIHENRCNERVCRLSKELRKKWSKPLKVLGVYFAYMRGKNPLADWPLIFCDSRYLRPNHVFQIWWRSIQGFSVGWGSNFVISHWFRRSSLQHSNTTVFACDLAVTVTLS